MNFIQQLGTFQNTKVEQQLYFNEKCKMNVLFCFSSVHASSLVNNGVFRMYGNKRFTSVTSTVVTSSRTGCANNCLRTNGCLAVSITNDYDVISCGLVTGPSDVLHDHGSNIYVFSESETIF